MCKGIIVEGVCVSVVAKLAQMTNEYNAENASQPKAVARITWRITIALPGEDARSDAAALRGRVNGLHAERQPCAAV